MNQRETTTTKKQQKRSHQENKINLHWETEQIEPRIGTPKIHF